MVFIGICQSGLLGWVGGSRGLLLFSEAQRRDDESYEMQPQGPGLGVQSWHCFISKTYMAGMDQSLLTETVHERMDPGLLADPACAVSPHVGFAE